MKRGRKAKEGAPVAPASAGSGIAWAVVAAALAVRLVVVAQLHDHPLLQPAGVLDDAEYFRLARRAAEGDWLLGPRAYYVSPLYIYFLAVVFKLFGAVPLYARVVQAVLGAAAVALVARCARRLFNARAAVLAAALAAATGVLVFNEALLLQSAIDPFLAALALERLSAALARPTPARFAAAGLAFGALGLNRPNALLALAAVGVALVVVFRSRRALARAALLAAGALFALAPVAMRNRAVAGEWLLVSSHGGLNFSIGNNPYADGSYQAAPGVTPSIAGQTADMRRVAEAETGRPLTDAQVSDHFYARSLAWMRSDPGAAARLLVRKIGLAFHSSELPLNYSYAYWSRDEPTLLRVLVVGAWLLVPLGLAGTMAAGRVDRRALAVWCSFVPAYGLAVAVFFVASRYRLPMLVALCVTAGGALDWAWRAMAAGAAPAEWRRVAAACALGLVLAFWPWRVDEGLADERTERIVHLVAEGRPDEARALFARTLPIHHDPGLLQYRVGRAWLDAGRPEEAAAHLEKSLALAPGQGEVHLAYGQALLALERPADALPHLERARATRVFPDTAGLELARALVALKRGAEARAVVAETPLLEDTDAPTAAALGGLALGLGDAATAERMLRDAVRRAPDLPKAHEALGLALSALGRNDEALAAFQEAFRLGPEDPRIAFNLALLLARAGRLDEARPVAARAAALDPASAPARQLLQELARP